MDNSSNRQIEEQSLIRSQAIMASVNGIAIPGLDAIRVGLSPRAGTAARTR